MIDTKLQKQFQHTLLQPLLQLSIWKRISPTTLTVLGFFFGALIPCLLPMGWRLPACGALLLSGFCDTLDGALARKKGVSSEMGAALDITSDRLVEFLVILALFLENPAKRGLLCLLMLGSVLFCITTFLVVGIFSKNDGMKSFHYSPGLMERGEAFLFFAALVLWPSQFTLLATAFAALVSLTGGYRLHQFVSRESGTQRSAKIDRIDSTST